MAKQKTNYTCTECGGVQSKWAGQCPSCQQWNTLVETVVEEGGNRFSNKYQGIAQTAPVLNLVDIEAEDIPRFGTDIEEFDRVLSAIRDLQDNLRWIEWRLVMMKWRGKVAA